MCSHFHRSIVEELLAIEPPLAMLVFARLLAQAGSRQQVGSLGLELQVAQLAFERVELAQPGQAGVEWIAEERTAMHRSVVQVVAFRKHRSKLVGILQPIRLV